MAFPHEGNIEIACNIEGVICENPPPNSPHLKQTCGNCYHVPAKSIEDRVRSMASEKGVTTEDAALIVGFEPSECERLANIALDQGIAEFWKTRTQRTM